MKLVSFTVVNYRSITKAHKIQVDRKAILVGPNNEGKSNLLRALVSAMRVLTRAHLLPAGVSTGRIGFHVDNQGYDWDRDYPVHLKRTQPQGRSVVTVEFELTDDEVSEFWKEIRSTLNGTLPIRISFERNGQFRIEVAKKGPGGQALTAKSGKITQFVSKRINFEHIPAIRTASSAEKIVAEMLERELSTIEDEKAYADALKLLAKIQQPILDRVSESIKKTLTQFLPEINSVNVRIPAEDRSRALRRYCQIIVDDGTATLLEHKGDGIQSLVALGMMRHRSESGALGRNLIIAIEEPESHLHPAAVHALRQVINDLSMKHQIVLTTHNPLFIDRATLKNNIVVKINKDRAAKSVEELRDLLGVRAADNLRHAELVVLVEGTDDKKAIGALLRHCSQKCKEALDNATICIDTLHGGTNLAYKASLFRDALCVVHCFLDDDSAGRTGFETARTEGLVADGDVNWATCQGKPEAELEDFYDPALYASMLTNIYCVSVEAPEFSSNRKWSQRMAETFKRQGKRWDDRIEADVKNRIADLVQANPQLALLPPRRSAFEAFVAALEARLVEMATGRE